MSDIVFFTSPIGLGHATRDTAISHHLGPISKKFVTGAGAYKLFSEYGFDAENRYVPPPFSVKDGRLERPLKWLLSYLAYYRESKRIASDVIRRERPSVVVSDEDFGSLVSAQKQRVRTILVTDILETSFASGIGSIVEKAMNRAMRNIIANCDLVILPEVGDNTSNIVRVGPIVRDVTESRESLRKKYSFEKKTVLVSTGGTDLGKFLIEEAIQVFNKGRVDAELVIVAGPTLQMEKTRYRNLGFVPNMHEVIYASDLVVSLAGKSTIDEAIHFGTPGIFIPIKGHFEQEENAMELGYSHEDASRLEEMILEKIDRKREPKPFDGARKAADIIQKFCS